MAERVGTVSHLRRDGRTVERSVYRCPCGEEVVCRYFTNPCTCGREYNMSGQLLAPREQWGAETGEHPADLGMLTGEEDFFF